MPSTNAGPAHRLGVFISDGTLELEDPNELAVVYAEYVADYRPTPGIETELVRQLAMATHRLRRLDRIENAAMCSDTVAHTRHEANVILGESFDRAFATLERVARMRTSIERSFNRVYRELEVRRKARTAARPAPAKLEVEIDTRHEPLASRTGRPGLDAASTPTSSWRGPCTSARSG